MGSRQKRRYADLSRPRTHWDLKVELPEDGMRLDRFMAKRVRWRSRTELQEMIDEGLVAVNGRTRRKAAVRLRDQDAVVIMIPEPEDVPDPSQIPIEILYEDACLVAVNKQPGIVVHPTSGHTLENVLSAMHARYRDLENPESDRVPHICHRIDKETSGVLLFAFSETLKAHVSAQFESRTVRKEYVALAHGRMPSAEGEVDAPILHRREGWPRLIVNPAGSPSRTAWRVEEELPHASLVRFFPHTGRTHQIRVHAAHVGNPLLCDATYGGARPLLASALCGVVEEDRPEDEQPILERVALHSARLELLHPRDERRFVLEAPLPDDLRRAVEALRRLA